ncbi:type-F conjugative transfer system pilin assembly family protein [Orientia tsutsugamushi str. TA716]|uniref:Type-F conjugative transfer system pilin assembly family protein n=1 Tax=Orientia tsutsugamushi str. TA716 TaxID=1359175 RepID=A0A0F3P0H8_ORITS|nr:type-F conjugative transfer system pilin assembly family protein [Orientia tsutsugamushi str. TA716]
MLFFGQQKTFIFVSFSMSDEALKSYFAESQKAGAQLVMRGLINNSFTQTKNKTMELGISFDIDPSLFEQYKIDVVPVIVIDDEKRGLTKKLTGHIPLAIALEIMEKILHEATYSLVLIILNINCCLASMQSSYNEAKHYNVNLGNSSNTQELFHQGSNVNYPNNDEDLTYHGRNQLGTESGAMLFQAENSKNNALTQHNINDQNYMIANSMRIESDPLSALDSSNFVTQTSTTNTEIIQSCTEGSKFNIELIRELNVECRLENVWLPWQNRQMEFATEEIKENHSNWLKSRSDVYDESGSQIYCLVDDPEAIERQMKRAIANRLGASTQHIGRNFY